MLLSACKNEYSYEGRALADTTVTLPVDSAASAHFELIGAPDTCAGAIVTGTFRNGDLLTPANTITLQVRVTGQGVYTITTDTLDGIYFSAAGRFVQTRVQPLILTGSGTPEEAGTFPFKLHAASMPCTFFVPVEAANAPASYRFVIDSSNQCANQIIEGSYIAGVPLQTSNQVTLVVDVKTPGAFTIKAPEVNGIAFSYSGHFTTAGQQYVKLKGVGIPQQSGTNTFIPRILGEPLTIGTGCIFYVIVQ